MTITLDTEQIYKLLWVLNFLKDEISAVKELREITGLSLKDSAALVNAFNAIPLGPDHHRLVCAESDKLLAPEAA